MNRTGLSLICLFVVLTVSCTTTYYTRAFRLESVNPGVKGLKPPGEVFSGPLGTVGGWDMAIRVISTFESNLKEVLRRDTFAVALTASSTNARETRPTVDSVYITLGGAGSAVALPLERVVTDTVTYAPEAWHTYRFGNVIIPKGVDTVNVRFAVHSPQLAVPEGKQFDVAMVRYEGKFSKLGIRPKGW